MQKDPTHVFNKNLIELLNILDKSSPGNGDVYLLSNRVKLAKNENRECLIDICRPFLLRYSAKIREKNVEFFLNVQNISEITSIQQNESREIVHRIFNEISKCYRSMKPAKFDEVYDKFIQMLNACESQITN